MNLNDRIFVALEEMGLNLRSLTAGDIRWQAVFFIGPAGSGKSFVRDNRYLTHAGFRSIDPDEIKKHHPEYDPEKPFEVHQWSQEMAMSQFKQVINAGNGDSVIVDGTGRNLDKMRDLIGMATDAGYRTFLVYVYAPLEISIFRNRNRTRFVPEEMIMLQDAVIEKNFGILSGMVDKYKVIQNFSNSELKLAQRDVVTYPPPQAIRPPREGEELQRAASMNTTTQELMRIAKSLTAASMSFEDYWHWLENLKVGDEVMLYWTAGSFGHYRARAKLVRVNPKSVVGRILEHVPSESDGEGYPEGHMIVVPKSMTDRRHSMFFNAPMPIGIEKVAKNLTAADKVFDITTVDDWGRKLQSGIRAPVVSVKKSTLGGPERVALMILVSVDEKKDWPNAILENSRYFRMDLSNDGTLEMFSGSVKPARPFRKTRVMSAEEAVAKINRYAFEVEKTAISQYWKQQTPWERASSELMKMAKELVAASRYGWIIDWANPEVFPGSEQSREKGTTGPQGISSELLAQLHRGEGDKFEMSDDDGVLYYKGRIVGDYDGFEPKDDYGEPNAGCTEIRINGRRI